VTKTIYRDRLLSRLSPAIPIDETVSLQINTYWLKF